MPKNRVVYIIGFMGCGKSTAGRKLASLLGWSFIDLDRKIEEHTGMTIADVFSIHGESYFREIESEILESCKSLSDTLISTGGGTPCHGNNMDIMLSSGLTIYLKMTPGQLKNRLSEANGERPLIKGIKDEEMLEFIEGKLEQREKWYSRAEIIVDGLNLNINSLHSLIKSRLNI